MAAQNPAQPASSGPPAELENLSPDDEHGNFRNRAALPETKIPERARAVSTPILFSQLQGSSSLPIVASLLV